MNLQISGKKPNESNTKKFDDVLKKEVISDVHNTINNKKNNITEHIKNNSSIEHSITHDKTTNEYNIPIDVENKSNKRKINTNKDKKELIINRNNTTDKQQQQNTLKKTNNNYNNNTFFRKLKTDLIDVKNSSNIFSSIIIISIFIQIFVIIMFMTFLLFSFITNMNFIDLMFFFNFPHTITSIIFILLLCNIPNSGNVLLFISVIHLVLDLITLFVRQILIIRCFFFTSYMTPLFESNISIIVLFNKNYCSSTVFKQCVYLIENYAIVVLDIFLILPIYNLKHYQTQVAKEKLN